jgi:transcriptional regulator with XRE-family HTH domain
MTAAPKVLRGIPIRDHAQRQFAAIIGVSYETYRNWERGRRRPHGPARALLRAIDADPIALARALNWHARDLQEEPIEWLDA